MTSAVGVDQLQPVLRKIGMAPVANVVPMVGGSSPVFLLQLADGERLVLKTYSDLRNTLPAKEAYASGLLAGLDIPVTRYLLHDDTREQLPFRFALTNYLPGVSAREFKDDPAAVGFYKQVGALLRKLHSVVMPGYGPFGAEGLIDPDSTNTVHMRKSIDGAFERFRRQGGDTELTQKLRRIVNDDFSDIVVHGRNAVFAHDDVHPGNVLAIRSEDGSLQLSGLIDFGNARAADAISDLAKCLFCSEHEAPGSSVHILEGYGPIDHPAPQSAVRYYTLLHRVTMWAWLRQIGIIPDAGMPSGLIDDLWDMARE